jgi:sortase A
MRRLARIAGTLMIIGGLGCLAWVVTVWQWQDPLTAVTHALDQRRLEDIFEERLEGFDSRRPARPEQPEQPADDGEAPVEPVAPAPSPAELRRTIRADAQAWRKASKQGDPIARLRLPTLDVNEIVVNGTDNSTLKEGPGRYLGSAMPGENELIYIAGHRTTYGAPFSRIDKLDRGDPVVMELPYGSFRYRITGHRIVDDNDLSVLESKGVEQLALQACHPRFFASQRYIAYAELVSVTPPGGEPTNLAASG